MAIERASFHAVFLSMLLVLTVACAKQSQSAKSHESASIPQRVVVIGPATAANIFALGAGDLVVGVSDYNTLEAARDLPRVGGLFDPNLERIAALAPDLVIIQGQAKSLEAYCRASEIEFRSFSTDTLAAWRVEIQWLAERLDAKQLLAAQLQRMDQGLAALHVQQQERRGNQAPPRVLLVVSRREEEASSLVVAGNSSFLNELLVHAGGQNVFPESHRDYFDLNEESLIRAAPDVILEFGTDPATALAIWRDAFPAVPAVRDGRVRVITDPNALMPGPDMLQTAQAIAAKLND